MINKRISDFLFLSVKIIFVIVTVFILFNIFFMQNIIDYSLKTNFLLPNIVLLIAGLLVFYGLYRISQRFKEDRIIDKIVTISSVVLGPLQFFLVLNYYLIGYWDSGTIRNIAFTLAINQPLDEWSIQYLEHYPPNITISAIQYIFARIDNHFMLTEAHDGYTLMILMMCLLTALTGFLIYKIISKLADRKTAFFGWLIYLFLIWINPWNGEPYTDALCLVFPIAIFYFYVCKENKIKWLYIGLLTALSYSLKPYGAVITIAIIILELIKLIRDLKINKSILEKCLLFILSFVIGFNIINSSIKMLGFDYDKSKAATITHYIMIGINPQTKGIYAEEDKKYLWTQHLTVEEVNEFEKEVVKERVADYGIKGFANLFSAKTLTTFNDGIFSWGKEGGFFEDKKGKGPLKDILENIYYEDGKYFDYYTTIAQMFWVTCLLMTALAAVKKDDEMVVLSLCIIGYFILEMMLECRARHIYSLVPFIIITATLNFKSICKTIKVKRG